MVSHLQKTYLPLAFSGWLLTRKNSENHLPVSATAWPLRVPSRNHVCDLADDTEKYVQWKSVRWKCAQVMAIGQLEGLLYIGHIRTLRKFTCGYVCTEVKVSVHIPGWP